MAYLGFYGNRKIHDDIFEVAEVPRYVMSWYQGKLR